MGDNDETQRTIAMCEECGALYAAFEISTGEYRPIGRRDGCQCGSMEFTPVDGSLSDLSFEEDRE